MATTNFLPFNQNLVNAENDAAYAADTLRTGGIPTAAIMPSATANKLFGQESIFVAAFCQMLVTKGVSTSDTNFANLVTALSAVRCSSDFLTAIVTVSYATSITFAAGTSAQFDLTLTGNVATSTLTGQSAGQLLGFIISQDGVGGRTLSWPSALTAPGVICSLPNSTSIQYFIVRPGGAIEPIGPMVWITASGLVLSNGPTVLPVTSSGNVPAGYTEVYEEANAAGGAITRTLFTAVGFNGSKVGLTKVDSSANAVTWATTGGQTIDGQSTVPVGLQWNSLTAISNGTNWTII
jgi:hypothetical protein